LTAESVNKSPESQAITFDGAQFFAEWDEATIVFTDIQTDYIDFTSTSYSGDVRERRLYFNKSLAVEYYHILN